MSIINKFLNRVTYNFKLKNIDIDMELIKKIRSENLTYLSAKKLADIVYSCTMADKLDQDGQFIEAGCALGGSSILISSIKRKGRELNIYDVFGMIPAPSDNDTADVHDRYKTIVEGKSSGLGGSTYYGYEDNLYSIVQNNFKSFNIEPTIHNISFIKGDILETMNINKPVAFAHVDVDWYDPVKKCLDQIFPNLVLGGCIILDDYYDWGGCRKATDEFLINHAGEYELYDSGYSMKIIKT